MQTETIVYIGIAGIAALLLALFQYIYKSKLKSNLKYLLFSLRALSLFFIGVLLINPKFESVTFFDEKPDLILAVDNSESIAYLNQNSNAKATFNALISHTDLNNRFNVKPYTFGRVLKTKDSLNFNEQQSDISGALKQFGEVYNGNMAPVVLITDGNQTYGSDYSYMANQVKQPIFPVILGDSTVYADLSIKQLNVNRFAFLKNRFPIEVITNYNGIEPVNTVLKIWAGPRVLYSTPITFDQENSSEIINTTLLARTVGINTYKVSLESLENEKNIVNNIKNFAVEVIDQKTNIALVADRLHPDLGAFKKAIESNEQRKVTIISPKEYLEQSNDFQLVILYQPNTNFRQVLLFINKENLNVFTVTGTTTDWNLLNSSQTYYKQAITNQTEDYQPRLNENYGNFIIDDISFDDYPPLKSEFGDFGLNAPHEVILYKTVNGIETENILLATFEANGTKQAILNGEGIWRWRAQTFIDTESFDDFDNFMNKIIQYLSINKKRNRINIDYKSFYNGDQDVIISAQYFNKNFEFDDKASLSIILTNADNDEIQEVPLLLNKGNYRVDLSGLPSGSYQFTVKHNTESVAASGGFEILEYNIEQQFLNAEIGKLNLLAQNSDGKAYFSSESGKLINNLLADNRFNTIQKSTKNIVPLIDWKYLLILIVLSLFFEWFIRKYNGLI